MKNQDNNVKKPNKRSLILAFIAILVIVQGVNLYFHLKSKKENEVKGEELIDIQEKMGDIALELDEKIAQIQELGGDVEDLKIQREQLEREKEELKKQSYINYKQYIGLKDKVSGYEELLLLKDKEIEKLEALNEELFIENTGLKTEKSLLSDSIYTINESKSKLEEKVAIASQLSIENARVYAVNSRGTQREKKFKNRHIKFLKANFNIRKNGVALIGARTILMRIIDPNGSTLFDVKKESGTLTINGKEIFYTLPQEILFDNSNQEVSFEYTKGSDYEIKGTYQVEFYTENYLLGTTSFVLK